ncbi:hypothetical protein BDQ12DRAFT_82955 [Crucibulum laeve]|uniref:Secreted protein n=1 Tax=Crucibulum laeve TaxID=68775 RepID=A0A5C3M0A0_9AGAR|nr:hypothetical protein BDQ12DRAFT_82955 [Crucibulum laeve]
MSMLHQRRKRTRYGIFVMLLFYTPWLAHLDLESKYTVCITGIKLRRVYDMLRYYMMRQSIVCAVRVPRSKSWVHHVQLLVGVGVRTYSCHTISATV